MSKANDRNTTQVVDRICRLPRVYKAIQMKSFIDLVEELGFREVREQINEDLVSNYLRSHPELIGEWQTYSADKRVSSGWYLVDNLVGYLEKEVGRTNEHTYTDPAEACAVFILNELTDMVRN